MGHEVCASDTFTAAPGNHSRFTARHFVTASPTYEPEAFLDDLEWVLRNHPVDRLIPTFEEVFYIARHRQRFERLTHVFAPSFSTLHRLHDKVRFLSFARELGLRVPETLVARDRDELRWACRQFTRFFARPAYGRGGVTLYTNCGPLSGALTLDDCEPTESNPFVVQPFVDGEDVCTFSVVRRGRVTCHLSYVHPLTLEHAGGIVFESVDEPETLQIARAIAEATGYHGQLSLDLLRTSEGLSVVECNPRPSNGLTVMPDEMLERGMLRDRIGSTEVAPAGIRRKLSLALLRNMLVHREQAPESAGALVSGIKDVYADPQDLRPLLYQLVAYGRVLRYRLRRGRVDRADLMQGYFDDICWNGDEMSSPSRRAA